jgi:hypothetical protein
LSLTSADHVRSTIDKRNRTVADVTIRALRDSVNDWVESGFADLRNLSAVQTSVNRQPGAAFYLWSKQEGAYLPLTIDVLRITGGAITEIVTFHNDQFPRLGLPERLPADSTE